VLIHPWVMGSRIAKEFLFTGNRMSAQRGYELGMVNRVVSAAQLEDAAMELALHIAKAPPFALRLVKKSLNRSEDSQGFREALSAHFDIHQLSHVTAEYGSLARGGLAASIKKISAKED
jgi:enoyl-CoA hydratase